MTNETIIAEIDRRQAQHLADIAKLKELTMLTSHEESRRARFIGTHVDAINTLEGIKAFIQKNTPTEPTTP